MKAPRPPAISGRGLRGGWGPGDAVAGVDLRVAQGERLALLGPNGAGKTTLFDLLSGRLRPRAGAVRLAGVDVTGEPLHRRARRGLGYVAQGPTVFRDLSVRQNLAVGARSPARRAPPGAESEVEAALERWGLSPLAERAAGVLSGGERRRVEIARALLARPLVLLLDEPFAGLDPAARRLLASALEALPRSVTLLISDHAAADVLELAGRVLLIEGGVASYDGPRRGFESQPAARRYFGA